MPRYRIRYEEPSSGGALTNLVLGALAGFAVGVLVAQKSGGIAGIAAGVKRRLSELTEEEHTEEPAVRGAHDSEFDEELDDEELEEEDELADDDDADEVVSEVELGGAVELEEEVLEAFQADPTLCERAIDISAVGDAVIEISGWVDTDAESQLAAAVARRIPGVESVVNRLAVGNADNGVEVPAQRKDSRGKKKAKADEASIEGDQGSA
ncbi:MAG TPA: BON domain-containing protein [Gemmatimonadaceae bacterium]|jgi:hypothetical protein